MLHRLPAAFRADGRWEVPSEGVLERLVAEGAPFASSVPPSPRFELRETYLDTEGGALEAAGVTCALRNAGGGAHQLVVARAIERAGEVLVESVTSDALAPLRDRLVRGSSRAVEALRRHVDVTQLRPRLQLDIARRTRVVRSRHFWRRATFGFAYDTVTLRAAGLEGRFHELAFHEIARGNPSAQEVADALRDRYALRCVTIDRRQRAEELRAQLERDARARRMEGGRCVALLAIVDERVAAVREGAGWRLPSLPGSGETAGRHLMRQAIGSSVGDLHLVTEIPSAGAESAVELWCCTRMELAARAGGESNVAWIPIHEMLESVARREGVDRAILSTLASLTRGDAHPQRQSRANARLDRARSVALEGRAMQLLDPEISVLRFNERVLHLAEDVTTPLAERLRYLAIVSSNLDEFIAVRVGRIKYGRTMLRDDGVDASPKRRLARVARHIEAIVARMAGCGAHLLAALAPHGRRVVRMRELSADEQSWTRDYFKASILPALTPRQLRATDGHSLPLIPDRTLALAVVLRNRHGGVRRTVQVAIPHSLPRIVPLPSDRGVVMIEDVVRHHLSLAFPGSHVEGGSLFRLVRHAELAIDDRLDVDAVQMVAEQARQIDRQPVVRIEVEQGTPANVRQLLLKELSFEPGARPGVLRSEDVCEVPGMLDLSCLRQLADMAAPTLSFAPFEPREALRDAASLWDAIRAGDLFLHHPYDDFTASVVRFVRDAADDPDVLALKTTLYRTGERSPIADALCHAALCGKDVTVFVELKARFDEARNAEWTRRLQRAGVHVVHGIPRYKNHAKLTLVVRREGDVLRRYAHVGTGNYNASTARSYTDFSLFTAREDVTQDLSTLFTCFTAGGSVATLPFFACLVAPHTLHREVLMRIRREARHARAGRPARIRMKVNGLADREIVQALYDASCAGAEIELVVRGICTLVPGVRGMSERITVVSQVGRFLEHARCLAFENDGHREWWIGSADLRPRNLHRRVELLAPVRDATHCARLDALFTADMTDPTAWRLTSGGTYDAPSSPAFSGVMSAQSRLMAASSAHVEGGR